MKTQTYWQDKLAFWLHDPVCKSFDITNREKYAAEIASALIQRPLDKETYSTANQIASEMTRAALPTDGETLDFIGHTHITHPLVKNQRLDMQVPSVNPEELVKEITNTIQKDLQLEGKTITSEKEAQKAYNYLFFALRRRLCTQNIGKLGALWNIIPADTRMPDHPLWHHLGMVSAIGSSIQSDSNKETALVVFSITPVQSFIMKARKLRDYWTGSVLLSYLSFTGITQVMEELGPDHVVYPSLQNQSLVDTWLNKKYNLGQYLQDTADIELLKKDSKGIASFPNKFVFICAQDDAELLCKKIQERIQNEWLHVSNIVKQFISEKTKSGEALSKLWDSEVETFWKYSWASSKLADLDDQNSMKELLSEDKWENEFNAVTEFSKATADGENNARLYDATHSLIQGVLAAGKMKPTTVKNIQYGKKCPLCGEHEILHDFAATGETSASVYKNATDSFWETVRERTNSEDSHAQVGEHEQLCAICAIKRFLPRAIKSYKDEILYEVFSNADKFPSTTEMAYTSYLESFKAKHTEAEYKQKVDALHNADIENTETENKDKYYAVLLMDGDKMGDLINGKTIEARWEDIINEKVKLPNDSPIKKVGEGSKRTMNPALHAMISDSLNNFARYAVQPAIQKAGGRLIYAGGDDVCAVLPLSTALDAADKIRKAYTYSFAKYTAHGAEPITVASPDMPSVGMNMGSGAKGISISGAIVLAHHKEPLREVISDAHHVLDDCAKEKAGRNALAIRLKKRSGGDRDFAFKWDEDNPYRTGEKTIDSFKSIMQAAKDKKIGAALLYKFGEFKQLVEPLKNDEDKVIKIFEYEVSHSGKNIADAEKYAQQLAGICVHTDKNNSEDKNWFRPEAAIIASFWAIGNEETDGGTQK